MKAQRVRSRGETRLIPKTKKMNIEDGRADSINLDSELHGRLPLPIHFSTPMQVFFMNKSQGVIFFIFSLFGINTAFNAFAVVGQMLQQICLGILCDFCGFEAHTKVLPLFK